MVSVHVRACWCLAGALAMATSANAAVAPVLTAVYTSVPRAMASVPLLKAHAGSVSRVALYSYTVGMIGDNFTLSPSPYGANFTAVVKELCPAIAVTPIINCGGTNAEANWKHAQVWSTVFTKEAVTHGYAGYVMDMEISHRSTSRTQEEFVTFLNAFGGALEAVNKTLQVITRYDFPKSYIVHANIESILSYNYVSEEATVGYIRELTAKYPSKAGVTFEPHTDWNGAQFFGSVASQTPYSCKHLAMWSDLTGMSAEFFGAAASWLANKTAVVAK